MDYIHAGGIELIRLIQYSLADASSFMFTMSYLGDPYYAFNAIFPLAALLKQSFGKKVLIMAILSEWINSVLKWMLYGERPYWWIYETDFYNGSPPDLEQYSITCEVSPGSPSGHAMVASATVYTFVYELIALKFSKCPTACKQLYSAFCIYMFLVCISRMFLATHFPHQVLIGTISGILLAQYVLKTVDVNSIKYPHYIVLAAIFLIIALLIYSFLYLLGVDPMWSVTFAARRCKKPEWVMSHTTLLYSVFRDVSCVLGLGFADFLSGERVVSKKSSPGACGNNINEFMFICFTVLISELLIKLPSSDCVCFFGVVFFKYMSTSSIILTGFPDSNKHKCFLLYRLYLVFLFFYVFLAVLYRLFGESLFGPIFN